MAGGLNNGTDAGNNIPPADALFVDAAGGNFLLSAGSPCFGTGSPSTDPDVPAIDKDGRPRPLPVSDTNVDMGAFEQFADGTVPVALSLFTATISQNGIVLVWRTESEVNNVGFQIYRRSPKDGSYTPIAWINGHGSTPVAHDYRFTDTTADAGETYAYFLENVDLHGNVERSVTITIPVQQRGISPEVIPRRFMLYQNYPNPFNPETWMPYDLAQSVEVKISIYGGNGKHIRTLHMGNQPAGAYHTKDRAARWDGRNGEGEQTSSGLYFYHLSAGEYHATRKMLIAK